MLMKFTGEDGLLYVIETNNVCRVVECNQGSIIIQNDGTPIKAKLTPDQYYNLVALSQEQAEYERSKRASRGL